jgi:hypothetical protein
MLADLFTWATQKEIKGDASSSISSKITAISDHCWRRVFHRDTIWSESVSMITRLVPILCSANRRPSLHASASATKTEETDGIQRAEAPMKEPSELRTTAPADPIISSARKPPSQLTFTTPSGGQRQCSLCFVGSLWSFCWDVST